MNRRRHGAALGLGLLSAAQVGNRQLLTSCQERDLQLDADTGAAADQHSRRRARRSPRPVRTRLERISVKVREHGGVSVEPMQLAAHLLEKSTADLSEDEAVEDGTDPRPTRGLG